MDGVVYTPTAGYTVASKELIGSTSACRTFIEALKIRSIGQKPLPFSVNSQLLLRVKTSNEACMLL